jgi:SM-20-related protein
MRSWGACKCPTGSSPQTRKQLLARQDWRLILNHGERLYEYDHATRARFTPAQRADLQRAAENAGRHGFQYLFESIRVPEPSGAEAGDLLERFAERLNAPDTLARVRELLGRPDVAFADCQATCYRPGHFLTTHDDAVEGKHRVAAYVFNLTPGWRAEWGGLLCFNPDPLHLAEAWVPSFNTLNLLRVPQPHFVSPVNGLAPPDAARLSVTGWFRSRR